jgi:hypothetical protein
MPITNLSFANPNLGLCKTSPWQFHNQALKGTPILPPFTIDIQFFSFV